MEKDVEHGDFINFDRFYDFKLIKDHISEVLVLKLVGEELPDSHLIKLVNVFFEYVEIVWFSRIVDHFGMGFEDVFGDILDFGEEFGDGFFILCAEI